MESRRRGRHYLQNIDIANTLAGGIEDSAKQTASGLSQVAGAMTNVGVQIRDSLQSTARVGEMFRRFEETRTGQSSEIEQSVHIQERRTIERSAWRE